MSLVATKTINQMSKLKDKDKLQTFFIEPPIDKNRWFENAILEDYKLIFQSNYYKNADYYFIENTIEVAEQKNFEYLFKVEIRKNKIQKILKNKKLVADGIKEFNLYNEIRKEYNNADSQNNISIGKNVTNDIKKLSIDVCLFALEYYLGKVGYGESRKQREKVKIMSKGQKLQITGSLYKDNKDFHFIINSFHDNLKPFCSTKKITENYNPSKYFNRYDKNKEIIHECIIERKLITQAINSLSSEYYCILLVWFFPYKQISMNEVDYKNKLKLKSKYSYMRSSKKNNLYRKIWKLKKKSIEALRHSIIDIQNNT